MLILINQKNLPRHPIFNLLSTGWNLHYFYRGVLKPTIVKVVRDGVSIKMTNLCKCDDWLAGFFTLMTVILFLGSGTAIGAVFSLAFAKREFRNINSGYTT